MTEYIQSALLIVGVLALVVVSWWARGKWEERKATIVPRLLEAAAALAAEADRLQQTDPASTALKTIEQATIDAKKTALKAIVNR